MTPKFGTSGLRGLVYDLTEAVVTDHVTAFARACPTGSGLYIGRDLRPSSPAIAACVARAARAAGLAVTDCGDVPTPALALAAMQAGAAAVMVTGSHIPADRNGLKFYTPLGEITKAHETAILAALGQSPVDAVGPSQTSDPKTDPEAGARYVARYATAYGSAALTGLRVGVYSHSAVGRDLLIDALAALGAATVDLGRSTEFVPVDTEAVDAATRALLRGWAAAGGLDAIAATDGDGDRPLMTDALGRVIPGDVLGQITAAALGAEVVVTPVSSNTGVEASGRFSRVIRTRIGSPFVIEGMGKAVAQSAGQAKVVGYEANGGFLLGFAAAGPAGPLPPLMTRDSLLPLIAPLSLARAAGGLAALVAAEPARFTATDRLQDVPTERSLALVAGLAADPVERAAFLASLGEASLGGAGLGGAGLGGVEVALDLTDGLRVTLDTGRIIHLRPSGNAPELRFYAEAETAEAAEVLLAAGLAALGRALDR